MPNPPPALENEFRSILAADSIRAAAPSDVIGSLQPRLVLEPANESELATALRVANDAGLAVVPRGGGTKLDWGNPPARADIVLSTLRLNKIIEHVWADLTVSVEAGCTVANLQAALAQHGQRLAIDPLWPKDATVGGILSANDGGALRLRFGALRDLILGVTIALPDGTLASSGGKVVKNVAGYDLPKLVTGALGTLGVITRAVFRLHPLPHNAKTLSISTDSFEFAQRLLANIQDSNLAHTSLQVRASYDAEAMIDVLFEGTEAGLAAQEAQLREMASASRGAAASEVRTAHESVWRTLKVPTDSPGSTAIAKITTLPSAIGTTIEKVQSLAASVSAHHQVIMQATGIGTLRLDATPENLRTCLSELRAELERGGGSLVIHQRPTAMPPLDAWGQPGDALPLMRALKKQFDAKNTLNPGRFVGGI